MNITLGNRTAETVRIYYEKSQNPKIRKVLPQEPKTIEEVLEDYTRTLLPDARSYGKIILADGNYIGDIWCYGIDMNEEPNAMLSYCIFEEDYWGQGIGTEAAALFLKEINDRYNFQTIGAFTFADNIASIRVLEKNQFVLLEEFEEDGRASQFFLLTRS